MACVALVKALGGGWDQTLPVVVPPVAADEEAQSLPQRRPGLLGRMKGWFKKDSAEATE